MVPKGESRIVKLSQREHVLFRPGMYIGSVTEDTLPAWAPKTTDGTVSLETSELTYTPATTRFSTKSW